VSIGTSVETTASSAAGRPTVVCLHNININMSRKKAEGYSESWVGTCALVFPNTLWPPGWVFTIDCLQLLLPFLIALATDTNPIWSNQLRNELQSQLVPLIANRAQRQRQWI